MRLRVSRRGLQIALGLIWLLDGGLQFQSTFYSHAFTDGLREQAAGQPIWLAHSITWAANLAADDLGVWNTLFALTQLAIGLGLLYRPMVKPALIERADTGWERTRRVLVSLGVIPPVPARLH